MDKASPVVALPHHVGLTAALSYALEAFCLPDCAVFMPATQRNIATRHRTRPLVQEVRRARAAMERRECFDRL